MTKREFIETREIVYVNAPIAPILQGDSIHYEDIAFKSQIGRIHSFSEQDIVKPYLDKLMIEVGNLEINKPMMSGYGFKQKSPQEIKDEVMKLIDNLLSESDWNASYKGGQEDGKA